MRTTIDLPEPLLQHARAAAAVHGISLRDLIVNALERETESAVPPVPAKRRMFPLVHLKHTEKPDLSAFDFDDVLP